MADLEQIIDIRNKIQTLVDSHPDELHTALAQSEAFSDTAEKLTKEYESKVNPLRQLHIGIVGRVKAGKSSLLNSLFFGGKNILPKAATPMTAALTKLFYSEKLVAKVNFFENGDIEAIKKGHERYSKLLAQKESEERERQTEIFRKRKGEPTTSDMKDIEERAKRSARSKLRDENFYLEGQADQYELYMKTDSSVREKLGSSVEIQLNDVSELEGKLADYVGANGRYTAITSNVEIGFPNESLKDITVVDTPGFDDPVASRDAMARDALRICDAIFVLSPSGSFCNAEDKSNIEKIEKGEGIQEVFVVASQIDGALCAPEYVGKSVASNLSTIVSKISGTLNSMLDGIRSDGQMSASVIDKIASHSGENLLFTSGACQSMCERWEQKSTWDEELTLFFNNLKNSYPSELGSEDDSALAILKKIANIQSVKAKMGEVREKKDEILSKRKDDFLSAKTSEMKDCMNLIEESVKAKQSDIENGDIAKIEEEQKKMEMSLENIKGDMEDALERETEKFTGKLKQNMGKIVEDAFVDSRSDADKAKGEETTTEQEEYTEHVKKTRQVLVNKETFGSGAARFFGGIFGKKDWGKEWKTEVYTEPEIRVKDYTVSHKTVNAHNVASTIQDFANNVGLLLNTEADGMKKEFKKNVKQAILEVWEKHGLGEACSNASRSERAREVANLLPDVAFELDWRMPSDMKRSGKLYDEDADEFLYRAEDMLKDLRKSYNSKIHEFVRDTEKSIDYEAFTKGMFDKMREEAAKLSERIKNKKEEMFKFEKLSEEIAGLKAEVEAL